MLLDPIDFGIIVVYLIGTTLLGIWLGRGQKDINEYFVVKRSIPWWAISLSIVATETSTVTFISVPGFAYAAGGSGEGGNFTFMQLVCGYLVGRILVSFLFIPSFFRGEILTVYQILRNRFGELVRRMASALFLITRSLADGFRLFLTALVLVALSGFDEKTSIIMIGLITIVYTYVGGMRAVIWADLIQFMVYIMGAVAALLIMVDRIPGGWNEVLAVGTQFNKFQFFDFSLDVTRAYTFWAGLVGGAFLTTATHGTDQMMVQRYLCSRNERQAKAALLMSGVIVFLQFLLFLLIGSVLFVFYRQFPPAQEFVRTDEVFPTFIVSELPVGLVGLIVAAVFAAAMSTLSSSLNSSAAASIADFYRPMRSSRGEKHDLKLSRWMTAMWGMIQIGVGILAESFSKRVVDEVLGIAAFTNGAILGVFLLGRLTPRVHQRAAFMGMLIGILTMLSVRTATRIAWPWYVLIGSSSTLAAGYLGSYLFSNNETT